MRQQPVGADVRRDGGDDVISATQVGVGIAPVFPGCAEAAQAGAGTSNRLLRNGPELGDAGFTKTPVPWPSFRATARGVEAWTAAWPFSALDAGRGALRTGESDPRWVITYV